VGSQFASLVKNVLSFSSNLPMAKIWRSLGGEGKITWTVIANKSGGEKQ